MSPTKLGDSRATTAAVSLVGLLVVLTPSPARADDDTPLARYRKGWNPFAAGPELVSSADLQPQGQGFVRPYIYSELAYGQFAGNLSATNAGLDRKLYSIAPQVELSYGLLDWLEFEMYVPETSSSSPTT
jgi:hypothetical protein